MTSLTVHSVVAARPAVARRGRRGSLVVAQASKTEEKASKTEKGALGLGDVLGPIGLTVGKDVNLEEGPAAAKPKKKREGAPQMAQRAYDAAGVSLGPIGLTIGSDLKDISIDEDDQGQEIGELPSVASMTTDEWRQLYEKDGRVDLWLEEEFNAGSRLIGGSAVHRGQVAGYRSGEGPGDSTATRHKVKIINHYADQTVEVEVPEDRYVLYAAEDEGLELPYACRLGCCTSCTVKVLEGEMYQPHSLGLSKNLREAGYALMCVSMPLSDVVLETVQEDEAYDLQFGQAFDELGTDPNAPSVERDDFAIELALLDE